MNFIDGEVVDRAGRAFRRGTWTVSLGGRGDLEESQLVWEQKKGMPKVSRAERLKRQKAREEELK